MRVVWRGSTGESGSYLAVCKADVSCLPLLCLVVTSLQLVAQGGHGVGELDILFSDVVVAALDFLSLLHILLECLLHLLFGFFG